MAILVLFRDRCVGFHSLNSPSKAESYDREATRMVFVSTVDDADVVKAACGCSIGQTSLMSVYFLPLIR